MLSLDNAFGADELRSWEEKNRRVLGLPSYHNYDATIPLEGAADTFATLADDPGAAVKILVDPRT